MTCPGQQKKRNFKISTSPRDYCVTGFSRELRAYDQNHSQTDPKTNTEMCDMMEIPQPTQHKQPEKYLWSICNHNHNRNHNHNFNQLNNKSNLKGICDPVASFPLHEVRSPVRPGRQLGLESLPRPQSCHSYHLLMFQSCQSCHNYHLLMFQSCQSCHSYHLLMFQTIRLLTLRDTLWTQHQPCYSQGRGASFSTPWRNSAKSGIIMKNIVVIVYFRNCQLSFWNLIKIHW